MLLNYLLLFLSIHSLSSLDITPSSSPRWFVYTLAGSQILSVSVFISSYRPSLHHFSLQYSSLSITTKTNAPSHSSLPELGFIFSAPDTSLAPTASGTSSRGLGASWNPTVHVVVALLSSSPQQKRGQNTSSSKPTQPWGHQWRRTSQLLLPKRLWVRCSQSGTLNISQTWDKQPVPLEQLPPAPLHKALVVGKPNSTSNNRIKSGSFAELLSFLEECEDSGWAEQNQNFWKHHRCAWVL